MSGVLIVDDHPIVLQGCRRILEDAGIVDLLEARDAVSGYELYRDHRPDVVIIDLAMQGDTLGGLSLIRRISEHDLHARILVLSMHSDPPRCCPRPGSRRSPTFITRLSSTGTGRGSATTAALGE